MNLVPDDHPDPDRKKAIRLYSALGATLILMVLPYLVASAVSAIMLMVVLAMASSTRKYTLETSLAHNHAIYIVRTVWIGSLFALISLALGSMYMLEFIDNAPLEPCLKSLMANAESLGSISPSGLEPLMKPCMDNFMHINMTTIIISAIITLGPIVLYSLGRMIYGLKRALGGYRIANPKAWF